MNIIDFQWWELIIYAFAGIGLFGVLPQLFLQLIALIFKWVF